MKKIKTLITGVNLIAAIVVINLLVMLIPNSQLDLTQEKIHSLSLTTIETIRNLDDVVSVKVFITNDLPPEIKPVAANLTMILKEIERQNPNKLKLTFADPLKDETVKKEAEKYAIQALQFSSIKSDKFEVQNGYFGLVMVYGSKQEVLPVVADVGNLEYFMVSGIKKLTSKDLKIVAIAEEPQSGNSSVQYFRKYLERSYSIVEATLDGDVKLPEAATTLVIVGRSKKIDDKGLAKIKDWVKQGKGLIVFLDRVSVGMNMQATKNEETGLENILSENGMKISNQLITDDNATVANFKTKNGTFIVRYPYWPQILPENINKNLPVLSGINSLTLTWGSPIETSGNSQIMFTSSNNSSADENVNDLAPTSNKNTDKTLLKKYTMGAVNIDGVKIALIGDSDMIKDQFVTNNQQNLVLALNLVDYFSQDSSLFAIRSKSLKDYPLKKISDNTKTIIKIVNITSPLVILIIGYVLSTIIRKRKIKKWYELEKE